MVTLLGLERREQFDQHSHQLGNHFCNFNVLSLSGARYSQLLLGYGHLYKGDPDCMSDQNIFDSYRAPDKVHIFISKTSIS